MEPHTETTIGDGRAYLNSQLERGKAAKCPCCTQTVKVYKRRLNAGMTHALIVLYKEGTDEYVHMGDLLTSQKINAGNTEYSKLAYWGLIEEMPKGKEVTAKRTSGFWKITAMGKAFAEDRLKVAEYVRVFNKKPLSMGGDKVGVRDTLGKGFDYKELMGE